MCEIQYVGDFFPLFFQKDILQNICGLIFVIDTTKELDMSHYQ